MTKARHIPMRKLAVLFAAVLACMLLSMNAAQAMTIKTEGTTQTKYAYAVYYLDEYGDTWYSGCQRTLYIKTDNPNFMDDDFNFTIQGFTDDDSIGSITESILLNPSYDDIEFLSTAVNGIREVEGGYIMTLSFTFNDEDSAAQDFELKVGQTFYGINMFGTTGCSFTARLENTNTLKEEWIQSYIDTYTTEDMDSFEKMEAVSKALKNDLKYYYYNTDTGEVAYLASDPNTPVFITYRADSAVTPSLLCLAAELIGGFDDIHNCYSDYTVGTDEWSEYHYYCRCTIGDEVQYFECCPYTSTNQITTDDIEMIDFSDTDSLTLAGSNMDYVMDWLAECLADGASESDVAEALAGWISESEITEFLATWATTYASESDEEDSDSEEVSSPNYRSCLQDESCPMYSFTDLVLTAWYHDGVHYCLDNGLMTGTSSTTFEPSTATTRSMIVTMLYRLAGEPEVSGTSSFTDVAEGSWYEDAVIWAEQNGIAKGYDTGEFGVSDSVTREQIATFFYRYAEYAGEDVTASADLSGYPDADEVSDWAEDEISWAVAKGLITGQGVGDEIYLAPSSDAMRSETATILMRFAEDVLQ